MNNFIWKYKNHNSKEINKISKDFSVSNSIATIMYLKSINHNKYFCSDTLGLISNYKYFWIF